MIGRQRSLPGYEKQIDPRLKHDVSFSGGKDSTAMLVRMLELGMPVDRVLFAETTFEFPGIYEHIRWMDNWLIQHGLKVTIADRRQLVKAGATTTYLDRYGKQQTIQKGQQDPRTFEDWFIGKRETGKKLDESRGWPKTIGPCYWMRETKYKPLSLLTGDNYSYIGFAADENRQMKALKNPVYPLKDWGWTEAQCLDYIKKKGIAKPIHSQFSRTGCFWCPYQSEKSARLVFENYPELWARMKEWDKSSPHSWRITATLDDIERGNRLSDLKWNGCEESVNYETEDRWF
jgi:3'-phosphoadenosine 5'-phosphosulfate sulfotransferase (PAPS reductase)/FAD synthetase